MTTKKTTKNPVRKKELQISKSERLNINIVKRWEKSPQRSIQVKDSENQTEGKFQK